MSPDIVDALIFAVYAATIVTGLVLLMRAASTK